MAKITVRYFTTRKRRDGSEAYYWQPDTHLRRNGWKHVRLPDEQADALKEAELINARVDQWRAGLLKAPLNETPGSVNEMIAAYLKSQDYRNLSPRTQKDYAFYLNAIAAWAGPERATAITPLMVQKLYEHTQNQSARKAAYIIQVLRLLYNFAGRKNVAGVARGKNPAADPGLKYKAKKGSIWPREATAHFIATADNMGDFSMGTAVMLNEWLGQRKGDFHRLRIDDYHDGAIHIRQNKTGAEVVLPVDDVPELKARLQAQIARARRKKPRGAWLLPRERDGRPYSASGFRQAFDRVRAEAAKTMPDMARLTFMQLRHTAVTRLGEAGCTPQEIAAITGHTLKSCEVILNTYNIRTRQMASNAMRRRNNQSTTNQRENEQP